ncbi:fluoride efflux transporter CrcB [Aquibacillus sediminis]|uniref:fluoride efflux transporter CrcB n=1 Tax=Aquibacillus sediminis TaxID=2574734 RepID=UPI0011085247|nr:fluoride efflux transporter CrcB [Aquibacillus sediminis]
MTLFNLVLVGIGGFAGAIARFTVSKSLNNSSTTMPIGTLAVNILGSFLLGLITGMQANEAIILLVGTGFLGAFTTFSTFKLEVIQIHFKQYKKALITYILLTYGVGIVMSFIGYVVGRLF